MTMKWALITSIKTAGYSFMEKLPTELTVVDK